MANAPLADALDRAEAALVLLERAAARAGQTVRDDILRAEVLAVVDELDRMIGTPRG